MTVAITNDRIFALAKTIAEQAGVQCDDEHVMTARKRLQLQEFDVKIKKAAKVEADDELLRKGLLAAFQKRDPHNTDITPDRRRELGELEVNLDSSGPRRIRVAHDPQNGALHLHGIAILTSEIDPALMRSFEATAAEFNRAQGSEEQEDQRILLGALLDRIMRRHQFVADAVTRRLDHERFTAI